MHDSHVMTLLPTHPVHHPDLWSLGLLGLSGVKNGACVAPPLWGPRRVAYSVYIVSLSPFNVGTHTMG